MNRLDRYPLPDRNRLPDPIATVANCFRESGNMSKCPGCGREVPGLETLCAACYANRYAEVGTQRSVLQALRGFLSNPLSITDPDVEDTKRLSAAFSFAFWFGGLLLCWFGGWARTHYQSSLYSGVVLRGALICFAISFALALVLARRRLEFHWRIASVVFLLISMGVAGHFYIGSSGIPTLLKNLRR